MSEEAAKGYLEKPWVKNYDHDVPLEIEIPEIPLYQFLVDSAQKYPNHKAMIFYGGKTSSLLRRDVTYSELFDKAKRFASFLKGKGIGKGDVVLLMLPNSPQFAIAYYGTLFTGATVSPMNVLYTPREIEHQAKKTKARVLVALDLFKNKIDTAEIDVETVVYTGLDDFLPALGGFLYRMKMRKELPKIQKGNGIIFLKDVFKNYKPLEKFAEVDSKKDVAALMFTGGTTGLPKPAMLSHYNLVSNAYQVDSWYKRGRKARDIMMGVLPWFHIYGQSAVLNSAMLRAATILVYPKWDVIEVMKGIENHKPNLFHGVPLMYQVIVNHPKVKEFNLSSLEACISGAAPLPVAVAEKFEELTGAKLREGYGLTETSPVTHVNPIMGKAKRGSIGLPVPNTIAAVADIEEPVILPPGNEGELVIAGPQVMLGYKDMPEENESAFFECCGYRWVRTGDIAKMDEEGYFYIVDRKKDLIKYKGYSIFPRDVEEVLYRHPCVKEAAVIGAPHKEWFEYVKAFVVLKDECKGKVNPEEIIEFAKKGLAEYKVPKVVEFRDDLPKTAVGKILRRLLREEELRKIKETEG
ncbi:MAG: long-chain fatty acid--CoA ligase [Desulfurococcales archaeon]|nr:long-chain fatty acid--CoA ligase [Desulfurococcales archaeon]